MGRPRIWCNTLGLLDFIRVPCPAARIMAVMLSSDRFISYLYALFVPEFAEWCVKRTILATEIIIIFKQLSYA